jgi:hypothetical protein
MRLTAALRIFILADAAIAALVDDRFGPPPLVRASGLPAITRQIVSGRRLGRSLEPHEGTVLVVTRVQLDYWSARDAEAQDLAQLVVARCERFCGVMGGAGGVSVDHIDIADDATPYEVTTNLYHATHDLLITHYPPS